jgi:hypothetical protein
MKLIGFNFNKISIEKISEKPTEFKVNTNINILNLSEINSEFFKSKEDLLGIQFVYNIDYSPKFAKLSFEGNILLSLDSKKLKEILKEWKSKKLPDDFRNIIFNIVLRKCNVKALQLEDEINLPLHIPMPILKSKEEDN